MTDRWTYVPPRLIANRYTLERRLADHELAERWQATDTLLDRYVEVRLLRPECADEPNAVQRLRLDGQNGQRARLLDGGSDGQGVPFAVFEWLDEAPPPATRPEPREASKPARAEPRVTSKLARHNLALPVILTCLPLAAGVIIVGKITSGQSMFQVPAPGLVLPAPVAVPSPGVALAATAPPTAQPTPAPAPARVPTPSPSPLAGERVRVANTDGIGVALRDGPGGNRLPGKGYDEGATVTVLERRGEWAHIRGDDGREGWVLAVTVPATGRQ